MNQNPFEEFSGADQAADERPFADFISWRKVARQALINEIEPHYFMMQQDHHAPTLFAGLSPSQLEKPSKDIFIPKEFLHLTRFLSCHTEPMRWQWFYSVLWRLTHGEPHLLGMKTDNLIRKLRHMQVALRRDAHKAKAFVRFRLGHDAEGEHYTAWHRSDHDVLPIIAPFFQRRFAVMRWLIITPYRSVAWDGEDLKWGAGIAQQPPNQTDAYEALWKTYYAATFNPARIKVKMMKQEMPKRYWATMPEAALIPQLLAEAPQRVQTMLAYAQPKPNKRAVRKKPETPDSE